MTKTQGQTIVEYVILIGIVITALYAMGPAFKRGVQTVIRGTSDQLAYQNAAEQDFSFDQSHLTRMTTQSRVNNQRSVNEKNFPSTGIYNAITGITYYPSNYKSTTTANEVTSSTTEVITNMGFTLDDDK